MTTTNTPTTARLTGWDRTAIIALGGAGCALSYDALQQMAVAIHVRGVLTYLFPLVIDGFIAYGVRALLVLRNAPLRARLYVWMLFGTATAASIWANALHAVRLNGQAAVGTDLWLGDTVVAVLSTLAPLALAGAVHLYILIARVPVKAGDRTGAGHPGYLGQSNGGDRGMATRDDRLGQQRPEDGRVSAGQPFAALTDRPAVSLERQTPNLRSATEESAPADSGLPVTGDREEQRSAHDLRGQPDTSQPVSDRTAATGPVTGQSVTAAQASDREPRAGGDRRSDPDTEELLRIARSAVRAEDKLTRKVVAQAIRGQRIPLSSDTLTGLMAQLRAQHGQQVTRTRN
ncbi:MULTISPECIES: DUF2637 domain-containing protein [unclassified Streptomyces]|uniref:DUF2637 domain-containing protein n=1 Tax=unclassified Streptomyces TaxID=2593676 RepID=UPI000DAE723E|nr:MULTISPECIES: DUF2637 domain-containing protein [unclassified Streptomyces]PZT76804.1 hypothetical protein DNK56_26370 [Streptomyces sp. AC1-42W]PZT79242.1 hypothetical protein DNK55_06310 [Streptomyces sp. AC1-42T]